MGCSTSFPAVLNINVFKESCDHDVFSEENVVLPNGSKRNLYQWIPKSNHIKGIVIIVHGLHEHCLVFDRLAHVLTAKDIACFGIDHFGHGLSDGVKGLIPDYRILTNDQISFVSYIRSKPEYAQLPTFIFAHSLGTLITLGALRNIPNITAVVFVGTALFPGYGSASPFGIKALYPLAKTSMAKSITALTSTIDPTGPAGPIALHETSNNPEFIDKKNRDGRGYGGQIMNKSAYEMLKLVDFAKSETPHIKTPFLAIHGKIDQIALVAGSQYLHDKSGTDKTKKSLVILENCKHHPDHEVTEITKDFLAQVGNYFDSFLMGTLQLRDMESTTASANPSPAKEQVNELMNEPVNESATSAVLKEDEITMTVVPDTDNAVVAE